MKTYFRRIGVVAVAIALAIGLFTVFLFVGKTTKGPLQDILNSVSSRVSKLETTLLHQRDNRSDKMQWLNAYRNNKVTLNKVDTILFGAYDDATYESFENIISLEDSLQQNLPIISIYTAWGSKKDQVFPMLSAQAIYDLGSIPMITWEPWLNDFDPAIFPFNKNSSNKNKGGLKAIAQGLYDVYIDKWASNAKKLGLPFFLRLGHEMNDPYRYPWGQQNNSPDDFIAAWKHVVERFRRIGANNAVWVWSPHPAYGFMDFYPGDEHVDWIGLTALNYGTVATWSQWWSVNDLIGKAYKELALLEKPIMLTEFGSLKVGGDRSAWYKEALASLPDTYPLIKAVIYFHAMNDATVTYKSLDWSFDDDSSVIRSINRGIASWNKKKQP
jgi:beta-mannanase